MYFMTKKVSTIFLLLATFSYGQSLFSSIPLTQAAQLRDVVISEIAWAGSGDSASDEWLELYNNTDTPITLTNWSIDDDNGAQTYLLQGTIAGHSYYLIESREIATSITADLVKSTSLSNAGDSLALKDANQNIIDTVNGNSGVWFAGSNTAHASMERISLNSDGDQASNWRTAGTIAPATSSAGGPIVGSPQNSGNTIQPTSTSAPTTLTLLSSVNPNTVHNDQDITISFAIQNATNISNYGLDIGYDHDQLTFISANEGDFLKGNGNTSFQSGLQNNQPGTIVIGAARTESPLTGKSGNGALFTLLFHTNSTAHGSTTVTLKPTSFLSTPSSHFNNITWPVTTFSIANSSSINISNLRASQGPERYSIQLNWDSNSDGPFQIQRQDSQGSWQILGTTTTTSFLDRDSVLLGGNIVPHLTYHYRVSSNDGGNNQQVSGEELRGLKSDNTRSDRVDGGDLEQIARLWTLETTDNQFNAKADTNFDGSISGEDLLDVAVDWAKTYQ